MLARVSRAARAAARPFAVTSTTSWVSLAPASVAPTPFDGRGTVRKGLASSASAAKAAAASAPIPPFHLAIPVHNLEESKKFYGGVMGLTEGRSSSRWQDYSFFGHQLVIHWVGDDFRGESLDRWNPVDGDDVPVMHFGVVLSVEDFHALADKLRAAKVKFIIEPHLRFPGRAGAQYTMFMKDPSGNNLEFKAMVNPDNLFAKYKEVDH